MGLLTVGILPAAVDVRARLEHVFSNRFGTTPTYRMPDVPLSSASRRRGGRRSSRSGAPGSGSHLDRIFGMFRRLHTHDRYSSTGIGHAVVKWIVERYGRRVRVGYGPERDRPSSSPCRRSEEQQ